jgi:monovalent cation:H+ antiporter-2, CPA2 family
MREAQATLAVAERDHVVICGFGRVGQNIARVLEQTGFEYIALDLDPYRIRAGRQAGDPVIYGDAGQVKVLENVGLAHASCVVITFANPEVALRILRAVRELRADVPMLVRTQDDTSSRSCRRPARPKWCRKPSRPASCCYRTCCCC